MPSLGLEAFDQALPRPLQADKFTMNGLIRTNLRCIVMAESH
jgi:hypothetical protein